MTLPLDLLHTKNKQKIEIRVFWLFITDLIHHTRWFWILSLLYAYSLDKKWVGSGGGTDEVQKNSFQIFLPKNSAIENFSPQICLLNSV